jgi:hypothetical protein
MGEGSIALARVLGINPDPRNSGAETGIAYVIFPESGNGKPRALSEFVSISQSHFQQWGGLPMLQAVSMSDMAIYHQQSEPRAHCSVSSISRLRPATSLNGKNLTGG